MKTLRFSTAGSVDDGKSTLIGRLLFDSKLIPEDLLDAMNGNLASLTDGLRAERARGITIDVAYRYFSTPRRNFIVADSPGHVEYTRNMVTGASTADAAIVLVDVKNGIMEQTRRHAYLSSLLRVPHLVVCVNKMDLAGWSKEAFDAVRAGFPEFPFEKVTFIPMSALRGDNVVEPSSRMPWYAGPPLLRHLEELSTPDEGLTDLRFPVQYPIRERDFTGFAGRLAGGVVRPGDEVLILPMGLAARVKAIHTLDGFLDEAFAPMSVTLLLDGGREARRGDVIVSAASPPRVGKRLDATVCWMDERPLDPRAGYLVKHLTGTTPCTIEGAALGLNDIGRVRVATALPLAFDSYARNRATGAFLLLDAATNATVAAGLID